MIDERIAVVLVVRIDTGVALTLRGLHRKLPMPGEQSRLFAKAIERGIRNVG